MNDLLHDLSRALAFVQAHEAQLVGYGQLMRAHWHELIGLMFLVRGRAWMGRGRTRG